MTQYCSIKSILCLVSCASVAVCSSATDALKVKTTIGTVHGVIDTATPNTLKFLGIPFAEPPIGKLRWLPPVAKSPVGSIQATSYGASCSQYQRTIPTLYNTDSPEALVTGPLSEDCLTLNIWKPSTNSTDKLPVIVWIYGGGYNNGGANIAYNDPSTWVERSQKHIVVGINYRVNIFGFPNAAGIDPSKVNLGLFDQRLGLQWVRANIEAFGGDASRIILWGQSAGASSTDYYNYAYPQDPIISGIILESGTAHLPIGSYDEQHTNFTTVAQHFGCGNLSPAAELACLRKVSSVDIQSFLLDYNTNGTLPAIVFNPIIDEITKFSNFTARTLARQFSLVPAIVGTATQEGNSLVPFNPSGVNVAVSNAVTIGAFLCPAATTSQDRFTVGTKTYRYLYNGNFSNISPRPWEGAYHSSDIPLLFGTTDIARGESTSLELALSHRLQDYWVAFATSSEKGLESLGWPEYGESGTALEFGSGVVEKHISSSVLDAPCL